jgi:hypothetical protein
LRTNGPTVQAESSADGPKNTPITAKKAKIARNYRKHLKTHQLCQFLTEKQWPIALSPRFPNRNFFANPQRLQGSAAG